MRSSLFAVVVFVALAAPAWAQTKGQPKAGFRMFVAFEATSMSASSTFKAETGSSTIAGFGGGGDVQNLWRGLFLRFGVSKASVDGERGFVLDGEFVPTGIPVEIGVRTIEIAAGWRATPGSPRLALYGGGGLLLGSISSRSPMAEPGENASKSSAGYVVLGGVEYTAWKYLVLGAEGQFRSLGGILGDEGSVSGGFNETNAGGATVRAILGFRFGR